MTSDNIQKLKTSLRQELIAQRQKIEISTLDKNSQTICRKLIDSELYQQASTVACYLAADGEPSLQSLIEQALADHKLVVAPKISDHKINFYPFDHLDELQPGKYGILEPKSDHILPEEAIDLFCIPLVAIDEQGFRLGRGGGYYDRTLKVCENTRNNFIGIGHHFQLVPDVPHQSWDIKLDWILTEEYFFKSKNL